MTPFSSFSPERIEEELTKCEISIVDRVSLEQRESVQLSVPDALHPKLAQRLRNEYPEGLYRHQSLALAALLENKDVALSTPTASGKSLVFITAALHFLLSDPRARVLAFYPAKSLIQDQIEKWRTALQGMDSSVGFIDGSVPTSSRRQLLNNNRVVLMTPDVAHAWIMSNLRDRDVAAFLSALKLVIMDEAHVYDGVFGTNMAYFLRRLQVAAAPHRVLCSTATLGRPSDFVQQLTGRQTIAIDQTSDGSYAPRRLVLLAKDPGFGRLVTLLQRLAAVEGGRFLAFADSRKMVEQIVAASLRTETPTIEADSADDEIGDDEIDDRPANGAQRMLPFRAGYEADDARDIQNALLHGKLGGVVSTSAMELGLDIGEIDLVVLLSTPPSLKAFWQRLGRAGRRRPGVCLFIDSKGKLVSTPGSLARYMERPLEPSWLYLDNRYLQYANVLCAAAEASELGLSNSDQTPYRTLPPEFLKLLDNELNPTEIVAADLYPLKQRAQGGPHHEFLLRSGIEQEFKAQDERGLNLGRLSFSQMLREAYPGAIYYYISRPYRVCQMHIRDGRLLVRRTKHWTTRALGNTMVFPKFNGGVLSAYGDASGFLAECELQVSERVIGFEERRGGATPIQNRYGPDSPYYRRELNRFFESTGVCWFLPNRIAATEEVGARILQTFCLEYGVQERDLGIGLFHSKQSPFGAGACNALCIYDAVSGSMRLTQRLGENFAAVVEAAAGYAEAESNDIVAAQLWSIHQLVSALKPAVLEVQTRTTVSADEQWTSVIAPHEKAIYVSEDGPREVTVLGHLFTPRGLMYSLQPEKEGGNPRWLVAANALQPMYGTTKVLQVDLMTGETLENDVSDPVEAR